MRLELVVVSATNDQVVDGHWSVKWVNKIEVEPVLGANLDTRSARCHVLPCNKNYNIQSPQICHSCKLSA